MRVPDDPPARCPVCDRAYDSVSEHDSGLLVNLLDNARYRQVCFQPILGDGVALVRFFHHTHEQVGVDGPEPVDRESNPVFDPGQRD